jgi:uncharacterized protein YyaL (SSP411 family)
VDRFWDEESGGFFTAALDASDLPVRQREAYDGALPSANAVAWYNALRLARLTGRPDLEERADRLETVFARTILRMPSAYTMWLVALDFRIGPSHEVVIATPDTSRGDEESEQLLRGMRGRFLPRAVVLKKRDGTSGEQLARLATFTAAHVPIDERPAAYACTGYVCQAPVVDATALLRALGRSD